MHILYLHQYFVPPDASGGTRSYEMARRLVAAGHRVTMVTSTAYFPARYGLTAPRNTLTLDGIDVVAIRSDYSNRMSYSRRLLAFGEFALRSGLEALRGNPDVIFATSTPLTIAVPGFLASVRHRIPMVFEVRDLWPDLPIAMGALKNPLLVKAARVLEHFAYHRSARVVALSPAIQAGIERTGYPADRIAVIPNSADNERFKVGPEAGEAFLADYPHLRGGPLVCYAGTLGKANAVGYLAEVAAHMKSLDPSVRFLVIGDGYERDAIEKRARELGVLGQNFWLERPIPKEKMPGLLSAATVSTVLLGPDPLLWEGSPNKLFDGLASGTPVLINYGGWQAEMLQRAGAGIVVPNDAPAAAARELHALLGDSARLRTLGAAARRAADEEFDRTALARKLEAVLLAAAGRQPIERDVTPDRAPV